MRNTLIRMLSITAVICGSYAIAQPNMDSASSYMTYIGDENHYITEKVWDYLSAAVHSPNLVEIEDKRQGVVLALKKSTKKIKAMPAFDNSHDYKNAAVTYFTKVKDIMQRDYGELIDLQTVSLKSYNNMENYMQIKELASQKVNQAYKTLYNEQHAFATANGIQLIKLESDLTIKMKTAAKVSAYYNKIYLIFFKSYVAEQDLISSMKHADATYIEDYMKKLGEAAKESEQALSAMESFLDDKTLIESANKCLTFFKHEANDGFKSVLDYYKAMENFEQIKERLEKTPKKRRTKSLIDDYNNQAKSMNQLVNALNKANQELNTERGKVLSSWNASTQAFNRKHIPK